MGLVNDASHIHSHIVSMSSTCQTMAPTVMTCLPPVYISCPSCHLAKYLILGSGNHKWADKPVNPNHRVVTFEAGFILRNFAPDVYICLTFYIRTALMKPICFNASSREVATVNVVTCNRCIAMSHAASLIAWYWPLHSSWWLKGTSIFKRGVWWFRLIEVCLSASLPSVFRGNRGIAYPLFLSWEALYMVDCSVCVCRMSVH